jgi:putative endonuclease
MFYIYVLQSLKDDGFYTAYSDDLKRRLAEHGNGDVISTRNRLPVKLVYYEASCNQQDALHREKFLKTAWGKRYVKTRLRKYLMGRAELSTRQIAETVNATGMVENKTAAKTGGKIARRARLELEAKTGKRVVTGENYLPPGGSAKKIRAANAE